MAIYTALTDEDFKEVASRYGLGAIVDAQLTPLGSINTNARFFTERARCFLRHTTVRSPEDLTFEAKVVSLLGEAQFPAPKLLRTPDGAPFISLRGGRVCLFSFIPGEERSRASLRPEHFLELGRLLGRMHALLASLPAERRNPYGRETVLSWLHGLDGHAEPEVAAAARTCLEAFPPEATGLLPRGVIHADLFVDNVKWLADRVSAFFDFEMACHDALLLDVAITLNAWCFEQGEYQWGHARALLEGYQSERPLTPHEPGALHGLLTFGAIRYTASRLRDFHLARRSAEELSPKDFRTYLARVNRLTQLGPAELLRRLFG